MDVENANCKLRVSQCTDMEILPIERPFKIDREIDGLEKLVTELHKVFSKDHVNVQEVQGLMAGYKSNPKHWRKFAKYDRYRYTRNLVDAGNGAFNIMLLCWGAGHASAIHDHADSHCFMKVLSGSLEEIRYEWPENIQPDVLKNINKAKRPQRRCCSTSEDKFLNSDKADSNMNCDNDSCYNFGGRINNVMEANDGNNGKDDNNKYATSDASKRNDSDFGVNDNYESQKMVEIGRTQLLENDVCYINDALGLHRMENPSNVDAAVSLHLYCPPFDSCRTFDARTGKSTEIRVTFTSMYGKKVNPVPDSK